MLSSAAAPLKILQMCINMSAIIHRQLSLSGNERKKVSCTGWFSCLRKEKGNLSKQTAAKAATTVNLPAYGRHIGV